MLVPLGAKLAGDSLASSLLEFQMQALRRHRPSRSISLPRLLETVHSPGRVALEVQLMVTMALTGLVSLAGAHLLVLVRDVEAQLQCRSAEGVRATRIPQGESRCLLRLQQAQT